MAYVFNILCRGNAKLEHIVEKEIRIRIQNVVASAAFKPDPRLGRHSQDFSTPPLPTARFPWTRL